MNIQTKTFKDRGTRVVQTLAIAASLLFGLATTAEAQISVNIGFDLGAFPSLVLIPGYPVYYDQQADANYFFYGDMYWVYSNDNWYSSGWYNGPWQMVSSYDVPLFVLRVPVAYYRRPPAYFSGWGRDAPPHWGEHYGRGWEQRRAGWDQWNHASTPAPTKLPEYQRQYSKERYPATAAEQHTIQSGDHRSQPKAASRPNAGQRNLSVVVRETSAAPAQHQVASPVDQVAQEQRAGQHPSGQPLAQAQPQHVQAPSQPAPKNNASEHPAVPEAKAHASDGEKKGEQHDGHDRGR